MLNSYGGRKATLKPQQSKQYPSSSSASKSGSFRLPSFLSTLPAIFGTNDESLNKQQFHQKDQQVDLGGYRGGGSSAAVDRDYYNYDRNNQEKNTTFALSEAQRRNLKGIYKTNNNNVAGNSNYNTTAVDGRKHSQNHVTGNNTRSNQPTSTATLQKPNNPSNNNNYKSMYPPGGAPSSNNLFPVKENSKSHLEPNKPNLPLQSQAETQAYIRGRYSTSTTTSKSSDQTTSSTASSSSVNNNTPSSSMFPSSLFPSVATSKEKDRESKTSSSAPPAPASGAKVVCDKCDGKHPTDSCPYYKKPREDHPDAQKGKQMGGTSLLPGSFLSSARVVRQPGDGSCLFHSMSYGYGQGYNATRLRSEICAFIAQNPDLKISDTPMKDWIRWDSNSTVLDYSRRMSRGGWGGGIEMAAFSQMKQVNVHVYERHGMGYKRISAFDYHISPETKPVIRVLYGGGVHYDALVAQVIPN